MGVLEEEVYLTQIWNKFSEIMASKTKDFFENGTPKQFERVLKLYDQALRLKAENKSSKPENIIKLDKWYQNDLPKKIKSRGKDAHLTHEEMVQTIKWKLARGKFRPNLSNLVQMNTPRVCMQETKKAFRKLSKDDMLGAVQALCNLKGVGPQMASAVLAAGAPHLAPFMADECLWAMPDVDSLDYTIKEYMSYIEHMKACSERINENGTSNWTPHRVELAVWTFYILHDLKPELLQELPSSKNSNSASDRVENQTNDDAKENTVNTNINSTAVKSIDDNSTDSSIPQNNAETHSDLAGTVIPTNGQKDSELSNHGTAADSGGTVNSSITSESNDAKADKIDDQSKKSDLNMKTSQQSSAPIMTNGKSAIEEKSPVSSSQLHHDVQKSPDCLIPQATNGTHNKHVKVDNTSENRLQSDGSSVIVPENGNSKNGLAKVPQNEVTSAAALTSNSAEEDWVMVQKEDCPSFDSSHNSLSASTKRLHETTEQDNGKILESEEATPLQKKLRTETSNCDLNTIEAIKKQQQDSSLETGASPAKADNGSSVVV